MFLGNVFLRMGGPRSVCWLKTCPVSKGFQLDTEDWEMIPLYPVKMIQADVSLLPLISWFKFTKHGRQEQRSSCCDPEARSCHSLEQARPLWTISKRLYCCPTYQLNNTTSCELPLLKIRIWHQDVIGLKSGEPLCFAVCTSVHLCHFPHFLSFIFTIFCSL